MIKDSLLTESWLVDYELLDTGETRCTITVVASSLRVQETHRVAKSALFLAAARVFEFQR